MVATARLRAIAQDLAALPEGAAWGEADLDMVSDVLRKHEVTRTEFMLLDDTPGRLGYDLGNGRGWHWKLRRFRNLPGALRNHPWPVEATS